VKPAFGVKPALGAKPASDDREHADKGSVREKSGSVIGRWATYIQFKAPGWTTPAFAASASNDALNRLHHIIAVVVTGRSVAVHLSDSSERLVLERQLGVSPGLEGLRPVSPAHLGRAFALDNTRTLWLSSTMLSVASRADTKVLAGPDLDAALDPLGDQTYAYTSARWRSRDKSRTHGVTPRRSQVWTGPSSSLNAFGDTALSTLKLLNTKTSKLNDPLPILARDAPLDDAKNAFDVGFIPDAANDGDGDGDDVSWRETVTFNTAPRGKHDAVVDVTVDGVDVGRLSLKVKADRLGAKITPVVLGSPKDETLLKRVVAACKQRSALRISYGTGHVISGGTVLTAMLTDAPFDAWEPADMAGFNRHKEKPTRAVTDENGDTRYVADLAKIGTQDSLFCGSPDVAVDR